MEFDLQRFEDAEPVSESESAPETSTKEKPPIPDELGGLPEEYARETMAEWEQMQAANASNEPEPAPEPEPEPAPEEPPITREQYQAALDEAKQLRERLAEFQRQPKIQRQQQPPAQPQAQPPMFTPETVAKINEAIKAEAMKLSGMSADDVASLEYADDDDPRISQWNQAKSFATNQVYGAIQQAQAAHQLQAQQFQAAHTAAINTYNEFVQKEFAEPDFREVQRFATNEFFEQLPPNEQQIVASSYLRVERQTASPAEMLVVKKYFERAKAAYRSRGAKPKPARPAPQLPRSDQLKGTSTTNDGQLSNRDIEKLLAQDFTTLTPQQQKFLLGLT